MSQFQLTGLSHETFAPLFAMTDEALRGIGARRVVAEASRGYPCRVSLQDAEMGDELLLLPYEHHAVDSPYRASGPIYVRRYARRAVLAPGQLTPYVTSRVISVRAYDANHWMVGAGVCEGTALAAELHRCLADRRAAYIHLHNAGPGCFSCRVERC